ncbi:sulfurtransferase [Kitasatospora sp. NA04385]|uniref:sulfurtransferase n=1 Tax=Kitasatospora sp. NA04385 TaxID=2742135 RepID=UPI001591C9CB|nr:rhodanese-like domain-containing protein [Kitasatospora sp. NA04385]QKW22348.1 sulfurtransferase [Kitasatospora sp. NA04385]
MTDDHPAGPPAGRDAILLSPHALAALLDRADVLVLDVSVRLEPPAHDGDYRSASGAADWARAHVPGSRHVDLRRRFADPAARHHFARPGRDAVRAELAALGAGPDSLVVVYDQGALQWASRLWWTLRDAGVAALVLDGGLPAWRAAGLPVATAPAPGAAAGAHRRGGQPARSSGEFEAARAGDRERATLWADRRDVRALSEGRAAGTLVCALGTGQFEGTDPTRYTRRGRIPGSVGLPAHPVLAADGTVRPTAELASYTAGLPSAPEGPVVVYCGGGISATLLALALVLTGRDDVRVYDGSLEEWTADPDLPVLTGPAGRTPPAAAG